MLQLQFFFVKVKNKTKQKKTSIACRPKWESVKNMQSISKYINI